MTERAHGAGPAPALQLLAETVDVGACELSVLRPPDAEALLDEDAFEHEEFLPYWAELWPSGLALARALARRRLGGARVVELGCGLALPSLAAAARGARVLATDWSPDAVALAARNAERNGLALETAVVDWATPEPLVADAPWDVVLAADVLYERRNVDQLLRLLPRLVDSTGEVLLADPRRPAAQGFFAAASERWRIEQLAAGEPARVDLHALRLRA